MNRHQMSREAILAGTDNGYAIFDRYLSRYYPDGRIAAGRNISNPFLAIPQQTPSFNIYQDASGAWRFKDFAHDDCSGDCFELAARVNGLSSRTDFATVLERIRDDCGLGPSTCQQEAEKKGFTIEAKPFSQQELAYWDQYGIGTELLDRFGVRSLSAYTTTGRNGRSYTVRSSVDNPIFAFPYGEHAYKLYRPLATSAGDRFRFVGVKPDNSLWGWEQLPERCETLLLTAGEKDTLTATAHGFHAVALNSETARLMPATAEMLRSRTDLLLSCYDSDETGRTASYRLWEQDRIVPVALPSWIADGDGKDLSDFFRLGGTPEDFRASIADAIAHPPIVHRMAANDVLDSAKRLQTGRSMPGLIRASTVLPERVSWIWRDHIPSGKIITSDGDPGLGKSTVWIDIAARISVGGEMPNGDTFGTPASVLLLSAEDGIADTIIPRLTVAGADLDRIHILDHLSDAKGGGSRPVSLPDDTPTLREMIELTGAVLVIIDPLMAYLSVRIDSHRDQDVRRVLHGLKQVAEETNAAFVICRHFTNGGGANALYRGGGSIGIIGGARVGLIFAQEPSNTAGGSQRRILAVSKSNVGRVPPALAYRIEVDPTLDCSRVVWEGPTTYTANELVAPPVSSDGVSGALHEAIEFLREELKDGPIASKVIEGRARDAGISSSTLRRAKERMTIRAKKEGKPGEEQRWVWELPDIEDDHDGSKMSKR